MSEEKGKKRTDFVLTELIVSVCARDGNHMSLSSAADRRVRTQGERSVEAEALRAVFAARPDLFMLVMNLRGLYAVIVVCTSLGAGREVEQEKMPVETVSSLRLVTQVCLTEKFSSEFVLRKAAQHQGH